eukprot:TRINITY_DN4351_c0_g1_i1.p1 TRINITY_DN4351_c0_g1~~TRINITY_DN4351_c0_g1_i1.p1  ORF type:complete len:516 (+),score=59.55 TRINITY_DN4351_c0_g1_i1:58-1605(+)
MTDVHHYDVVVVGGGIAGIASAVTLAKKGLHVGVFESRSILGGRARSWIDGVTRDPVHIGPHVVVTQYPNFFNLLEQLGTGHKIVWQPDRHFVTWVKGTKEYDVKTLPIPAPFSWGLIPAMDPFVKVADSHSNGPAIIHAMSLKPEQVEALDDMTGAEWLRGLGVSETYINHFWGFLCHAILNVPVEEASATAMVRFFRQLASSSKMEMGFSDGGLGDLVTPAKDVLKGLGATVETNAEIVEYVTDESGEKCEGVRLDDGRILKARLGVVSTLPPHTLLPLLPRRWVEKHAAIRNLQKFKPCKYICVYIWFDRKVTGGRQMWARTYEKKDLNCEFYDFSEIYTGTDSKGTPWRERPSFVGSNIIDAGRISDMTDEELVEGTLKEMEEFFTDIRQAKVVHSVVNRVPMAIVRTVAGTESCRPDQQSPVSGLYFGGCWTKTGFPYSMESATRGGFLAAEKVLAQHGQPTQVAVGYPEPGLGCNFVGTLDKLRPALIDPFFKLLIRLSGGVSPVQSKL